MVKIIRENVKCRIEGLDNQYCLARIDKELSYTIPGFSFQAKMRSQWDGRYRLLSARKEFLSGFLDRVISILNEFNIKYEIDDRRPPVKLGIPLELDPNSPFKPRDYQLEVVNAAYAKDCGVVKLPTGSGKTLTLSLIAGKFNIKTIIYVIGVELLYQMKDTLEKMYPNLEIGIVGDGKCIVKDITIATIWSAAAALDTKVEFDSDEEIDKDEKTDLIDKKAVKKLISEAQMYIFDECQFVSTTTALELNKHSLSARYKFLFSGTPWRDAGDDIYIEGIGGKRIYNKTASWMIENGYLVAPKIYFIDSEVKKRVGKTYPEVYRNYIIENQERNDLIKKAALKMHKDGRKILILVSKVDHGKALQKMLEDELRVFSLDGRNKTEQRLEAIRAMKNGEIDILIASKIFDQGIDIPELDALILAGSGKSSSRALQRIGRVIRKGGPNKKDAVIVDFWDNCKFLKDHSSARKKIYETEPLFKIIVPKV